MRLLLDTHLVLWAAEDRNLSRAARTLIEHPESRLLFSVASLWEIAIKAARGRQGFRVDVVVLRRGLVDNGYSELAVTGEHIVALSSLPPIHKDPFDRMLVAQAISEAVTLVTTDAAVAKYPGPIRLV